MAQTLELVEVSGIERKHVKPLFFRITISPFTAQNGRKCTTLVDHPHTGQNGALYIAEFAMEPFDTFVREWPVIQQAPVSFLSAILTTIAAVGIGAYKASSFVYKSEIGNLKSDNDTLEKKHEAKADIYEQRIKRYEQEYASLERENARLRIFAEENARKTFEGVHLHPGHKITINIPAPQAAVLPQYRPLVELGMLKVEEIAPSVSTVASTGTAAKLWDSVQQSSKR